MKGLLSLLAGAADTLDFIPGFDPVKDKQGLISHLLGGGSNQPVNPSGVPPIVPQNSVQKRPFQGAAPGGAIPSMPMKPPNPADFTTSYNILDVFNPFKDTNKIDRDDAHRFNTAQQKYESQQAQTASQQQNQQLTAYLTQAGLSPAQIAQVQASNMLNADETGKNLAENLGPSSLGQGELGNNLFRGQTYNPKTPTPLSPEEIGFKERGLEIDQQNADTNRIKANKPGNNGITIGPDGSVQIGGPAGAGALGRQGDSLDKSVLGDALTDSSKTDQAYSLLTRAEKIINSGDVNSGGLNRLKTSTANVVADIPFVGGVVDENKLAASQEFRAINNQLAAAMLEMFGGSDTERELAISVASNVGPDLGDETNKRMIGPAMQFVEIQRQKPEFRAQWLARFGGVDAINPETGKGMQATWDEYLSGQHTSMFESVAATPEETKELNDVSGWTDEKERRLQYLRSRQGGGS
jgi:hypothetical protein